MAYAVKGGGASGEVWLDLGLTSLLRQFRSCALQNPHFDRTHVLDFEAWVFEGSLVVRCHKAPVAGGGMLDDNIIPWQTSGIQPHQLASRRSYQRHVLSECLFAMFEVHDERDDATSAQRGSSRHVDAGVLHFHEHVLDNDKDRI